VPARSFRVYLSNNTFSPLTLTGSYLCHGQWTDGWQPPPQTVAPQSMVSWQSESDGILTGTEGWVKYDLQPTDSSGSQMVDSDGNPLPAEKIYLHWDNPYAGIPTSPECFVELTEHQTACGPGSSGNGNGGSTFGPSGSPAFESFSPGFGPLDGDGQTPFQLTEDFAFPLNLIPFAAEFDNHDHIWGAIGLRMKGSVDQSLALHYNRSEGLRPLAVQAKTSSLRTLFHL
jgi:hypothetical protein